MVYRSTTSEDLFAVDDCRNSAECNLTLFLNERAAHWIKAGVVLIGPIVQTYEERKLVFFLDPPDGRLLRVEYDLNRAVVGRDLTGQGGPDLDPTAPGVLCITTPDGDLHQLALQVADFVDLLLGIQR